MEFAGRRILSLVLRRDGRLRSSESFHTILESANNVAKVELDIDDEVLGGDVEGPVGCCGIEVLGIRNKGPWP